MIPQVYAEYHPTNGKGYTINTNLPYKPDMLWSYQSIFDKTDGNFHFYVRTQAN